MGKLSAKNSVILINGYLFSTYASSYSVDQSVNPITVTGFGDESSNSIPGLQSATISTDVMWDSATDKVHLALKSMPTGQITIIPEGYSLGTPSISMPMMQGNYNPQGKPDAAITVGTLQFSSYGNDASVENGIALAHATITNTATGTGVDDPTGAAVTASCGGVLHIWTPTTADTYVVKIQHSSDNINWVDLITFVSTGTTRTVERITVASGTINRYRRAVATRTGSAGNSFGYSVLFYHL